MIKKNVIPKFTSKLTFNVLFLRLPFSHETPIGFLAAMVGQIAGEFCLMLIAPSFMIFFIGSSWSLISFLDDIVNELSHMEVDEMTNRAKQEIRKNFCNIVQMYSYVKQLCFAVLQ